ncbi:hypothetical protein IW18_16775 [Flavobacterium hibernum]|uniref:Uncharacterized protein n=1 Tax=Flavobacterium hibernum TaxID=37752 RepID=A0A0D0EK54_9FLAO|nr:hypothetical protein IW18_16775 [Flavobacterium hibernum]OXA86313.1 hypothetical protein B0A73_14320 [Flavobacterium hibernum]
MYVFPKAIKLIGTSSKKEALKVNHHESITKRTIFFSNSNNHITIFLKFPSYFSIFFPTFTEVKIT